MALENKRKGIVAVATQTAVGTPNATIEFAAPLRGGTLGGTREQDEIAVTASNSSRRSRFVKTASGGGTITMLAHPEILGFFLYKCMGAKSTTGAGPYVHVFTMADTFPTKPITAYFLVGDSWERLIDAYVTNLTISGGTGENLEVEVELMSYSSEEPIAAPTYAAFLEDVDPRFKFLDSTFLADSDSGTPTAMTNIDQVSFSIARAVELNYGTSLTAVSHIPTSRDVDFSAQMVYDSAQQGWDYYRAASKGVVAGGTPVQDKIYGSVDVTFGIHPSTDTSILKIESGTGVVGSASQVWDYDVARPEVDPAGGKIVMDVAGRFFGTVAGATEATVTLTNSVTSYTT